MTEPTDEQLNRMRVKCAELCGWSIGISDGLSNWHQKHGLWSRTHEPMSGIPDYPRDLNAMHEAENTLSPIGSRPEFIVQLRIIVAKHEGFGVCTVPEWHVLTAQAWQRCLAFILTHEPDWKL
jgi:hypothetical protein